MRVLAVTPWWPTSDRPNFAPFMVRDVEMLETDHELVVLHLANPDEIPQGGAELAGHRVIRVPYHQSKPSTWLSAARAVRSLSRGADIVHTMALPALIPSWLAQFRKPWIHTEHYGALVAPGLTLRQRFSLWLQRQLLRFPDQIVAVASTLTSKIPGVVGRVHVIGNHVLREPSYTKGPYGDLVEGGAVRALAVGNLVESKGPAEAVHAVAELSARGVDISLRWVGTGPLEAEVLALARSLAVSERVTFVGSVSPARVQDELRRANLFLLPTRSETFGVAIAEALAHGLPVVTSGVGGHLGFLPPRASRVSERRGDALADAVESLVADPERMQSKEIWEWADERFSDGSRLDGYRKVYRAATNRPEV